MRFWLELTSLVLPQPIRDRTHEHKAFNDIKDLMGQSQFQLQETKD